MSNIVFLDFDGPMFPKRILLLEENRVHSKLNRSVELDLHPYINYWKMDPVAICMLNRLYDISYYELVISSSWADDRMCEYKSIKNLLLVNDINAPLHEEWRTDRDFDVEREIQIAKWLKAYNKNVDYLILDDLESGKGLSDMDKLNELGIRAENIILADVESGIGLEQYQKMLDLVKKWK